MAEVDIRAVGGLLGHKSLSMTVGYWRLTPSARCGGRGQVDVGSGNVTGTITDTDTLGAEEG